MQFSSLLRLVPVIALSCSSLAPLAAQNNEERSFFLCRPELKIEPTFTVENIFSRHRVAEMKGNEQVGITRAEREVVFETILALDVVGKVSLSLRWERLSPGHHAFFYTQGQLLSGAEPAAHDRLTSASTVNFEVGTLRTFFYHSINNLEIKRER